MSTEKIAGNPDREQETVGRWRKSPEPLQC